MNKKLKAIKILLLSYFFLFVCAQAFAGNIFNNPKFQAIDSAGLPLSGGKVYTYEAGTTTPKTTYSDDALTSPNTNPVVLNSRGEATIYFSGSGNYKIVLKDSDDNTLWTEDDLTGFYNPDSLGTAAAVDVGTGADEVPQNSDLGTAAYKDTGSDTGDIVELEDVDGSPGLPAVDGSQLAGLSIIQTGSVIIWPLNSAPTGYMECDGAAVSRTTFASLFTVIGVTYGNGDGSTTFNLPDYRGYFLRGWDHSATVDPDTVYRSNRGDGTTGDNVGTIQQDDFEAHTHTQNWNAATHYATAVASGNEYGAPTTPQTGSTGGSETRPKNINVMFCIKY